MRVKKIVIPEYTVIVERKRALSLERRYRWFNIMNVDDKCQDEEMKARTNIILN